MCKLDSFFPSHLFLDRIFWFEGQMKDLFRELMSGWFNSFACVTGAVTPPDVPQSSLWSLSVFRWFWFLSDSWNDGQTAAQPSAGRGNTELPRSGRVRRFSTAAEDSRVQHPGWSPAGRAAVAQQPARKTTPGKIISWFNLSLPLMAASKQADSFFGTSKYRLSEFPDNADHLWWAFYWNTNVDVRLGLGKTWHP